MKMYTATLSTASETVNKSDFFGACMASATSKETAGAIAVNIVSTTPAQISGHIRLDCAPENADSIRDNILQAFADGLIEHTTPAPDATTTTTTTTTTPDDTDEPASPFDGLTHAEIFGQFDKFRKARAYDSPEALRDALDACASPDAGGALAAWAQQSPANFTLAARIMSARNTAGYCASTLRRAAVLGASVAYAQAARMGAWQKACDALAVPTTKAKGPSESPASLFRRGIKAGLANGLTSDELVELFTDALASAAAEELVGAAPADASVDASVED